MANNLVTPTMVVRYALRGAGGLEVVPGGSAPDGCCSIVTAELPFWTSDHVRPIEEFIDLNRPAIDSIFDELLYAKTVYDLPVISEPAIPSAVHRYNGVSMRGTMVYAKQRDSLKLRLEVAYAL